MAAQLGNDIRLLEIMLIRLIWKDSFLCDCDTFWLEASKEEAETLVFPLLDDDAIAQSKEFSEKTGNFAEMMGKPELTYCYLISRDLDFIRPFHVHYPVHQLWNGYSPFEEIPEITITNMNEIEKIKI